jgi:hypothetical protein
MVESLQASPSATTRQVAQSFSNRQNTLFDVGRSMFNVNQFLIWFDWTLTASGGAHMKLQVSMGLINNVVAGFIPA